MSRIFGFKHIYSKEFLDRLAKELGFEWTFLAPKSIPSEEISVNPLPPPTGKLYYCEFKYDTKDKEE